MPPRARHAPTPPEEFPSILQTLSASRRNLRQGEFPTGISFSFSRYLVLAFQPLTKITLLTISSSKISNDIVVLRDFIYL